MGHGNGLAFRLPFQKIDCGQECAACRPQDLISGGSLEAAFDLLAFENLNDIPISDVIVVLKRHAAFLA